MTITQAQGAAALAAIKTQFRSYTDDLVIDGDNLGPTIDSDPTLIWDWTDSGHPVIAWESGPDAWALRATAGGVSEEEAALMAAANAEFGATITLKPDLPSPMPRGVYAEPYSGSILALYPDVSETH
jgi:hypothetical protein